MARKIKSLEVWCHENNRDNLLAEWNYEKNISMKPSETEYNTSRSACWKCHEGHEWESPIVGRTLFNLKCPVCNPKMSLPIGTKYGCLTIIDGFDAFIQERLNILEKNRQAFLSGKKILSGPQKGMRSVKDESGKVTYYGHSCVDDYDRNVQECKLLKYYKCQCECGQIRYIDEVNFLKKRHRYCTNINYYSVKTQSADYQSYHECGLKKKHKEKLLESYKRVKDDSYYVDYTNTIHESLEILECVDDNVEEPYICYDKRKKGGATYKVYKRYKCRCYLCGKEYEFKSSDFSINPPTAYGATAYNGYFSKAKCTCHKISSFQWIVTKILKENNVPYRVEVSFPDLYGAGHINLLRYDFSVLNADGSIKCLIECQGEQHFKPVDEFGGKYQFGIQKKNDDLKRIYAEKHGIPLYEIPYTSKKYENVESFLKAKKII